MTPNRRRRNPLRRPGQGTRNLQAIATPALLLDLSDLLALLLPRTTLRVRNSLHLPVMNSRLVSQIKPRLRPKSYRLRMRRRLLRTASVRARAGSWLPREGMPESAPRQTCALRSSTLSTQCRVSRIFSLEETLTLFTTMLLFFPVSYFALFDSYHPRLLLYPCTEQLVFCVLNFFLLYFCFCFKFFEQGHIRGLCAPCELGFAA